MTSAASEKKASIKGSFGWVILSDEDKTHAKLKASSVFLFVDYNLNIADMSTQHCFSFRSPR